MSALNADEPGVDNTGRPEAKEGKVKIEASTARDLHLGDGRVIYGDGEGHAEEGAERPKTAMVDADTASALVGMGKARRA